MEHSEITVISPVGDLILDVRREGEESSIFSYRVEASRLKAESHYFSVLLSDRFNEGATIATEHKSLLTRYKTVSEAPDSELPRINILDIGKISKVSTIKNITADFLHLMHGHDLNVAVLPLSNVANLAIVADRFDALPVVAAYMKRKGVFQKLDAKVRVKSMEEEKVRQRLLVGLLLDYSSWVSTYSKRLILQGSRRWELSEEEDARDESLALWWDLPNGAEDELRYRREMVLETISSMQTYYLRLYTSGDRQCKLGYDSSLACDSFQLGQMVRFLRRIETLRLQSTIFDTGEGSLYTGSIDRLIESLRKCPEYQLDSNHAHCGLRTRLIPLLDWIQFWLEKDGGSPDLGLCAQCWKNRKPDYAWLDAKRPLIWQRSDSSVNTARMRRPAATGECSHRQFEVREMFTAVDRRWD